ncbi:MAG: thioesterase family protein [Desulfobacterales bacterium]|nr:thioesterase family protein [Desulfobacterales bacterium]
MHRFDQDISLAAVTPLLLNGNITDNWSINGIPNGGYIMALLAGAMLQCTDKKEYPILTANYISKCVPGKGDFAVEIISNANQLNRLQVRLLQKGMEKVRAIGTFTGKKNGSLPERIEAPAPDIFPLEDCVPFPARPHYSLFNQMDVRLDPRCAGWLQGNFSGRSEQKGWIRFRDERMFDVPALALIADTFPPAVLAAYPMVDWVPTIEYSVHIRHVPDTRWLKCVFRTRFISCGLIEEDGRIWDENGKIVAISRQIAQFRPAGPQP